jgi:hypothetical protein
MQPQYPNLEYDDARTVVCGADFHNEMNLSTIESGNGHSGSTRPEKINTFAVHCDTLLELNVSMHDDHESAEYGVRTTIRCAGIGNYPIAFIDILDGHPTRFVTPKSIATHPIPVVVEILPHHQGDAMSFFWTADLLGCGAFN